MSQPRDDRQDDLFRSSLEQIINLRHPLVRLAAEINWDFLAKRFSSVCRLGTGAAATANAAGGRAVHPQTYAQSL
jgi:IS5 family transposase